MRSISLICPNKYTRICSTRWHKTFTYTFSGSTVIRGLDGSYLSRLGVRMQDRVHLLYTDTPFALAENFASISRYTDALREAAFEALTEEAILVVVLQVYHTE